MLIKSEVPQGSILEPVLYLLYTADLMTSSNAEAETSADDMIMLAVHECSKTVSINLQVQQYATDQ